MEPGHRGWVPPPPATHANEQQGPRPGVTFGPGTPQHQPRQSPPSRSSGLPPPSVPFPPYHQPHSLANLAGINQSPRQQPRQDIAHSQPPPGPSFALPALLQATGQPSAADRERERAREAEQIHIKEEEDRRHREQERQRMEQAPPHQTQGPPVHLHQPVAVGPRSVHGPNGLLGNAAMTGQPAQMQLGAPPGPGNIFAGGAAPSQPLQSGFLAPYGAQPHVVQQQQQQQQQINQGQGQGQQPILNDALSYLDQVKVQFADHPDVYNQFLDIMKDFKSGAIDTPGVIGRVSTLFAGNPELIQGFNTFLPPGYRIHCDNGDPNAIRVTTPMGTTVQSIGKPQPPRGQQEAEDGLRPINGTYTPQPGAHSAQMVFSPTSGRPLGPAAPGPNQHLSQLEVGRQEQQVMNQQDQRGVNSLQNAISATANSAGLRSGASPRATPLPGQDNAMAVEAAQQGMEKRGPVEFNHAISYVNKIKNRFASQPDIYKQFLEILQTYQRESKPIQDVYGQVTQLFKTAPDLLEDFKQFLPESAAHAKAAERERQRAEEGAMLSNVRAEGAYISPVVSREPHMSTPNHGRGLPPVGNFAPTPASKDNKRKRTDRQGTIGSVTDGLVAPSGAKAPLPGPPAKRIKQASMAVKGTSEPVPTSPTLVPALPTPIEPIMTSAATLDELSFFDKAKKTIGNKGAMNEFLKLCNLFSQDLIDKSTLVYRVSHFLNTNPDLAKWFKDWIGYDERDVVVENKPRIPSGRIGLSNCRGYGPSYRLLPKRERQKTCSGRDELCNSVLNDEWASHPTWASEDSGFIAHRKNAHEEGLHRIEEERHDYDLNIEACNRTIQLLEPIATQLRRMDEVTQRNYQLPPGLGGQSESIYKRVIMKVYTRDRGQEVIESLHARPYQVIPILLNRLKERIETWKMVQREWEKIWREQTQRMFWKSLDHQAALLKNNDRRQFQLKALQSEIQVKYEEMKRANLAHPGILRKPQMEFTIDDQEVILDTTYLILRHVESVLSTDHPKLYSFIRDFVPLFFGLDGQTFKDRVDELINRSPNNESAEELASGSEDANSTKARKGGVIKNPNLLRAALDPGRSRRRDSNASGSRASTPEVTSNADEDMGVEGFEGDAEQGELAPARWLEHPLGGNMSGGKNISPNEPQRRDTFPCWANMNIYCFIRLFLMLYERLYKLKISEAQVRETVRIAQRHKPAIELNIIDKLPHDYFADTSDSANYYQQMLSKFDDFLRGDLEFPDIEDTLRRFYLQSGYPLYAFEKIVTTLTRTAIQILNNDAKDKAADIYQLFRRDRVKEMITAQQANDYRKAVDKMVKEPELYKIDFNQLSNKVQIFLVRKDEPLSPDGFTQMDRENRWRFYIASYTSVDKTDGVDPKHVAFPFVIGNVRAFGADPQSESFPPAVDDAHQDSMATRFLDMKHEEKLEIKISVDSYRAIFGEETHESFHAQVAERNGGKAGVETAAEALELRADAMAENWLAAGPAAKLMGVDESEAKDRAFASLVENGEGEGGDAMEVDT